MHNWPGTGIKHVEEVVHYWRPTSKTSGLLKSEAISMAKVAWPSKWPFVTRLLGLGQNGWIVFGFALDEPTINLLSYGRTLYVTVGTQNFQYDLTRSEAVLKALIACIEPRMASANPFASKTPVAPPPGFTEVVPANPFAETTSNPYRRM